jgi:hypothetical protein
MAGGQENPMQLEQELEQARRHGRWLADDEREALALAQQQQAETALAQRRQRRKLLILTVVCVLIPPLWPMALALVLYRLFPRTTRRFGLIAGVILLVGGALVLLLLLSLVVAILMAVF